MTLALDRLRAATTPVARSVSTTGPDPTDAP